MQTLNLQLKSGRFFLSNKPNFSFSVIVQNNKKEYDKFVMRVLANYFPTSDQTFKFDWISLVFLLILLFCIIRGIQKGFLYTLLNFFGMLIIFFIAYLLAKPVGEWLYTLNGWGDSVQGNCVNFLVDKGSNYLVSTGNDIADAYVVAKFGSKNVMEWIVSQADLNSAIYPGAEMTVAQAIQSKLGSVGIPSFLQSYVMNFLMNALPETNATSTVAVYLANSIASLTFVGIGFIALFLVGYIILIILKIIAKKINHVKGIGGLNRLLGGLLGICIAFIDISALSALLVTLSGIGSVYNFLDGILYLSDSSVYTIGKMFYNENFFGLLMGYYNDIASSLFAK